MCATADAVGNMFRTTSWKHQSEAFDDSDCHLYRCQHSDSDSECSTVAESEPVREATKVRWVDLMDSEDERELDISDTMFHIHTSSAATMADLADSYCGKEQKPQQSAVHASPRSTRNRRNWADLAESDDEQNCSQESSRKSIGDCKDATLATTAAADREKSAKVRWVDLDDSDPDERNRDVPQENHKIHVEVDAMQTDVFNFEKSKENDAWQSPKKRASGGSKEETCKDSRAKNGSSQNSKGSDKGSAKGMGKGANGQGCKGNGKGHSKGRSPGDMKLECQFVIGIEEDRQFCVVKRIIGTGGANMKNINQKTGAKLRLRGRGSNFLEGPKQLESTDDLMLCISSKDLVGYEDAKNLVTELLKSIYDDYRETCRIAGKLLPALRIQLHEGAREGAR